MADTFITYFDNFKYPLQTRTSKILQIAHDLSPENQWQPRRPLPTRRSRHLIELLIPQTSFPLIRQATQQRPVDVLVYLTEQRAQNITTTCFRELIAHEEMTRDTILNTFLAILCAEHNLTFLSTFFIPLLKRDKSWLSNWFAKTIDQQDYSFPLIYSNLPILIPCHVHGAHWVGLVCRVVNNRV